MADGGPGNSQMAKASSGVVNRGFKTWLPWDHSDNSPSPSGGSDCPGKVKLSGAGSGGQIDTALSVSWGQKSSGQLRAWEIGTGSCSLCPPFGP